jgi:hypothetical protein
MLTARYVFSRILHASATRAFETGTTSLQTAAYSWAAKLRLVSVTPPTTFGIVRHENAGFPGSSRSGLNAKKKSFPARNPDCSRIGLSSSSVVPG